MLAKGQNLFLREFVDADALFIVELLNSRGWIKFIGDRNVHSEMDALSYLHNGPMKTYALSGFGFWCVCFIRCSTRDVGRHTEFTHTSWSQ